MKLVIICLVSLFLVGCCDHPKPATEKEFDFLRQAIMSNYQELNSKIQNIEFTQARDRATFGEVKDLSKKKYKRINFPVYEETR